LTLLGDEDVIAPGGPRPPSSVRHVAPGERVRRTAKGSYVVEKEASVSEEMVITPGGVRAKSLVHEIEPGHVLDSSEGRLRRLGASGETIEEYGLLEVRPPDQPLMPGAVAPPAAVVPELGSGWITYATWVNGSGTPVSSFWTTWTVPPPPDTQSGQVIFLFNGIQNATMIYQPVLQWGQSGAGGGNYWAVASWYADGQGGQAFHSSLVQVNSGDVLVGIMTLTGEAGANFSYNCEFQNIANTALPITNVEQLTECVETLECYKIQQCSDYPDATFTGMGSISIETRGSRPSISWAANDAVTDCGQHTIVVSDSAENGDVDLYYHQPGGWAELYSDNDNLAMLDVANNADGRLEVFGVNAEGHIWHTWQDAPNNGWAGGWAELYSDSDNLKSLKVARNADGRLEVFGVNAEGHIWHTWQTSPNNGWAGGWAELYSDNDNLAMLDVANNADGRLEVFGVNAEGHIWHTWQDAPNNGWVGD
jgi:peptide methionine sulfoxide reductase MsrB